ncbi:hypothetical protein SPRG_10164 [Saprolegnia parasitica CBS 223.65]|uniref:Uncharacterized protein n=1 Tax=Saprolegnia parasitica (strain CBS 223.65) TaxID=695850 RepID=A0A067CCV5_SAPPC|nr:hypothetical protein SPRG_10164 [Saprolegnia parasitica CBS 223.65]KDO24632.1 hypothetical protein SPRG_10164 [Saprolegnia parasitica CBS 223.65]|eukprot:XP_012204700.1 hypothetical protein SPRG_10164 [Saprolegnia parasitica CBS 223.65]
MTKHDASVQKNNFKKVKLHKKKRMEAKNQKKVFVMQNGSKKTVGRPAASKKKVRRDTKRAQKNAKYEQEQLLKSGLITQEDIDKLAQEQNDMEDAADAEE